MVTLAEARAKWVADTPRPSGMSQADYDAMADSMADNLRMEMNRLQAAADRKAAVDQFTSGLQALRDDLTLVQSAINTGTTLTPAQVRVGFRDLLQAVIWLGDRIKDGTIETNV